jgi:hypothetical protein
MLALNAQALANAEDFTILAPAADAMRKMLLTRNDYAAEFNIVFSAKKMKLRFFVFLFRHHALGQCRPKFTQLFSFFMILEAMPMMRCFSS